MPESYSVSYRGNSIWGKVSISFVATTCAVFLLYCFYKISRNNCFGFFRAGYRRNNPNGNNPEDPSLHFMSRGLSYDVLNSIQAVQYSEEIKKGDVEKNNGISDCAICFEEFIEEEWLRVLPNCSHGFHVHCVDTWLSLHSDCPLCRKQVLDDCFSYIPMGLISLQSLPREDIHRERLLDHHVLESEAMRNEALRTEDRGMQSLMWL